jgi:glycosyltransferase involved in cell wall biosynthesis
MAQAAIFVAPSLYEPFGLAVLEAAARGCALALADIPSFRENWSDAALFFDPRDPGALAATLCRLSSDPGLTAVLGEAGRKRAALFTLDRQADAMVSAYGEALAARRSLHEAA